jgi:hypothetical protein
MFCSNLRLVHTGGSVRLVDCNARIMIEAVRRVSLDCTLVIMV